MTPAVADEFGEEEGAGADGHAVDGVVGAAQLRRTARLELLEGGELLLQRAGRLHRHERERPQGLAEPRLLLVEPENANDLPSWGNDAFVYEPYMLLRTFLLLRGRPSVSLPAETQALETERDALRAEVDKMRHLTRRLSDQYRDLDLLDERAREVLGMVRSDEILIPPPD